MLDVYEAILGFRQTLLQIAEQHTETIVPVYTNGVQAQPISYAYYLHSFSDSFADPCIAKALVAMHQRPAFDWDLELLAHEASMSRTGFATKFHETMQRPPGKT